jgi:hypothetical protein
MNADDYNGTQIPIDPGSLSVAIAGHRCSPMVRVRVGAVDPIIDPS